MIVILIFITSLVCMLTSCLALFVIARYIYNKQSELIRSNPKDAILITGCDSGIGLALAKYLLTCCEYKIICGFLNLNNSEGYTELDNLLKENPNRLILLKLDVRSDNDVDNVKEKLAEYEDRGEVRQLCALINNAGVLTYGEFDWLTWDQISKQVEVNLVGTMRLTRALLPRIMKSRGRVINVSSVNDATVFPGTSVYSATKAALSIFSRGLGYEMRKFGAHVITVRLGDFARLTNIMHMHTASRDAMWAEMDAAKRAIYKDYFHEFNRHLLDNYGMTSPREFADSTLFEDFKYALLSKHPPTDMICAPVAFKVFYFVIELLPIWLQYHLIDLLIRVGFRWQPPEMRVE